MVFANHNSASGSDRRPRPSPPLQAPPSALKRLLQEKLRPERVVPGNLVPRSLLSGGALTPAGWFSFLWRLQIAFLRVRGPRSLHFSLKPSWKPSPVSKFLHYTNCSQPSPWKSQPPMLVSPAWPVHVESSWPPSRAHGTSDQHPGDTGRPVSANEERTRLLSRNLGRFWNLPDPRKPRRRR